ncbi:2,3-bisphosphoglycerate-independent phosphoglycerate mutase [Candidatus Uhrbacteria bacterium]|jgi:2,3-bisphosphoglycerate-independent phosphoglycerate mutase|nr:2,3-bisphosphoglycerate-independent phosphoglycerate mutase [Candidatus Uhrbacteria bacterium]
MPEGAATKRPKPLVLLVLDGWGIAPDDAGNSITRAETPVMDSLIKSYPSMPIHANGAAVGLGWGDMGNSEVGHLTIGSGRVYYQSLPRIDRSIEQGDFYENEQVLKAIAHVKKTGGTLHIAGCMSEGRVHAYSAHCYVLMEMAKQNELKDVAIHAFLDGRDTLYNAGYGSIEELIGKFDEIGVGRLATMSGRHFAMDRDNKWDRIQKAYDAIVLGKGEMAKDPLQAIKDSYAKEVYDEQFVPTVITKGGKPVATVKDGDAFIFFNFRPDRARQLTRALVMPTFEGFERDYIPNMLMVTMMKYESGLPVEIAFGPEVITKGLSEVIANTGLTQLHVSETEKYAHVTFFFNGTREDPFPGEEREVVPSPKVASYDEVPQMSAAGVTDKILKSVKSGEHDVIIVNYANADMVAHTGNFDATVEACQVVDAAVGRVVDAVLAKQGVVLITADHGNAEEVSNLTTGDVDKEHSTNPVPFIIIGNEFAGQQALAGDIPGGDLSLISPVGVLADVAPTILHILGIPKPQGMTGQTLIS